MLLLLPFCLLPISLSALEMCPFGLLSDVYPVNNVTLEAIGMNFLVDSGGLFVSLVGGWLAGWQVGWRRTPGLLSLTLPHALLPGKPSFNLVWCT